MSNKFKNQKELLEKYNELKRKLDSLKSYVKPVYEFQDFGNYSSLINSVKEMQIKIAESQNFYD